jgi:hypothetical protein
MPKRLSNKDFMRIFEAIYEHGPKTKYQNPTGWRGSLQSAGYSGL